MHLPRPLVALGHPDAVVLGDDVVGDGEDGLGVDPQPRNLQHDTTENYELMYIYVGLYHIYDIFNSIKSDFTHFNFQPVNLVRLKLIQRLSSNL